LVKNNQNNELKPILGSDSQTEKIGARSQILMVKFDQKLIIFGHNFDQKLMSASMLVIPGGFENFKAFSRM